LRPRLRPAFFDELYAGDPDPWKFLTSEYETAKYKATIDALQGRRFDQGLELGCSIGVLTQRLAERCTQLTAIDVSEQALEHARARNPRVTVELREIPEQFPHGPFDLIVASEVLYYLDVPAFNRTVDAIRRTLVPGGALLAVHWRHPTKLYPLLGDEVHERLRDRLRWPAGVHHRTADYVLERFDRPV
jgi:predicted TPR repeat methyltransferase